MAVDRRPNRDSGPPGLSHLRLNGRLQVALVHVVGPRASGLQRYNTGQKNIKNKGKPSNSHDSAFAVLLDHRRGSARGELPRRRSGVEDEETRRNYESRRGVGGGGGCCGGPTRTIRPSVHSDFSFNPSAESESFNRA